MASTAGDGWLHVEHLQVAWVDTDASGRIHWSSVFRWAELAEHQLLGRLGRPPATAGSYPRRSAEVTYHRALKFGDRFEVRLGVQKLGRTSVTFGWRLYRGGELCVEGSHTVVHVGDDGRPRPWPGYLQSGLATGTPVPDGEPT